MNIALIDDKEFGRFQIERALGRPFPVVWFPSVRAFLHEKKHFDIVFLDFYLENDGITGDRVISDIRPFADIIIGFSSCESGNKKMLDAGADIAFQKLWGEENEPLEHYFLEMI